jgi:hypothetical protein
MFLRHHATDATSPAAAMNIRTRQMSMRIASLIVTALTRAA